MLLVFIFILCTGSTNLQYQVNSILAERGVEINVDYSDYSNFIYFSSALTRLENFYYKLQLIEEYSYSASLSNLAGSSAQIVTSKNIWEEKINEIITTFDGYDYFYTMNQVQLLGLKLTQLTHTIMPLQLQ
jgi:hypothetical protein